MSSYQALARDNEANYLEVEQATTSSVPSNIKTILSVLAIIATSGVAILGYVTYQNGSEITKSTKLIDDQSAVLFKHLKSLESGDFTAVSSGIYDGGPLPDDYICGEQDSYSTVYGSAINNPPMSWVNVPDGTKYIAVSMGSLVSTRTEYYMKYDWFIYNIPTTLSEIPSQFTTDENGGEYGIYMGGSYDMDKIDDCYFHYLPPCSHGSGTRDYYYTVYALSDSLLPYIAAAYGESSGMPTVDELTDSSEDTYVRSNVLLQMALDNNLIIATSTITVTETVVADDDYGPVGGLVYGCDDDVSCNSSAPPPPPPPPTPSDDATIPEPTN